jgi:hypothetical protein
MAYDPNDLHGTNWSKVPDSLIPSRRVESARDRKKATHFIPPVPLGWFDRACVLPGKALAVGLILWRLAKMRNTDTVTLTQAALKQHGLGRWVKYDALRSLERAGLVSVRRRDRKSPEVTLLGARAAHERPGRRGATTGLAPER